MRKTLIAIVLLAGIVTKGVTAQEACTEDESTRLTQYSLYYEDWKNQSYETALPYLKWILRCAPGFPSGSDRNFRRAIDAYVGLGLGSEDPELRRQYLDSALYIHDSAVTILQDAGIDVDPYSWKLNKGRFIQDNSDDLADLQEGVGQIYREAFDIDPTRLDAYYINFIIVDYVQREDKSGAIDFMDLVESSYPDKQEMLDMIDSWRDRLFTNPGERIDFLEGRMAKDPENVDLISELFELYRQEGRRDKVYDLAPHLMELDPSAKTYRQVAAMRLDDGDTDEAISLYQQSLEMEGGLEAAKEVYFNMGIAHLQEERYSRARTSFRAALRVDPNFGDALIAIGDLYVSAVQGCGTFERRDRAVYWLASDYFDRAAARDASSATVARQRNATIRQMYPTAEDKFFVGWEVGDVYNVNYGCYAWIGETTKVR